jgi:hypothetical protein
MKLKSLRAAAILATGMSAVISCQKQGNGPDENSNLIVADTNHYQVSVNVASFEAQYTNMRQMDLSKDSSLYLKYLYTAIYDSTGKLVTWAEQKRYTISDTSFGKFKYSLTNGRYTTVFVSTTDTAKGPAFLLSSKTAALSALQIKNYWDGGMDVFYNKTSFNVSGQDAVAGSIQLARITGKVEVAFNDQKLLLDSTRTLGIAVKGFPATYSVGADTYNAASAGDSISLKRLTNATFEGYCLGSNNKIKVVIRGYFSNYPVWTSVYKTLDNVDIYIYPNKKTSLTGYLYDNQSGSSNLGVNTDFSETIVTPF